MFKPQYTISNSILENIVRFEVTKNTIKMKDLSNYLKEKAQMESIALDIFHLSQLVGSKISLKEARSIASGKSFSEIDYRGNYLTNFRNAIEYFYSSNSFIYPLEWKTFVHINKLMITNVFDDWEAKLRIGGEPVDPKDDNWIELRDQSLKPIDVQTELTNLIDWVKYNESIVSPVIVTAILIYKLIRIFPFVKLNKLSIITIAKFIMLKNDLLCNAMIPSVKLFDQFQVDFIECWKNTYLANDNLTQWIEKFSSVLSIEANNTLNFISKLIEDEKEKHKQPFLNLNRRQLKILRYLQTIPVVKREEYMRMMEVSTMTAYRDLSELTRKGLLKTQGKGRGITYSLTSR